MGIALSPDVFIWVLKVLSLVNEASSLNNTEDRMCRLFVIILNSIAQKLDRVNKQYPLKTVFSASGMFECLPNAEHTIL